MMDLSPHLVSGSCFLLCTPVCRPPAPSALVCSANLVTHTQLFHTRTQFFRAQHFFTDAHTHTTLSHATLSHTHTTLSHNSFSHKFVTHAALSHTILSRTTLSLSHTQNCLTYTSITHTHSALSHNLSSTISFIFPAFPVPFSRLFCSCWKKLTCGVIRFFNCFYQLSWLSLSQDMYNLTSRVL